MELSTKRARCASRMCYGMPIQKGCFVFSIINIIICSLAHLYCLSVLIDAIIYTSSGDQGLMDFVHVFMSESGVYCVATSISLFFAIILCIGVDRSKKRYLMAYLVYGVITLGLTVVWILTFIFSRRGHNIYVLYSIEMCVMYAGILNLVHQMYEELSEAERTPATQC